MTKSAKKIVMADDNHELCEVVKSILENEGYKVSCVYEGLSLIAHLKKVQDIDVIILDLMMPERGGESIFDTIRSVSPASKIIIYTGYTSFKHSAVGKEADAFIGKAETPEKLIKTIKALIA